MNPDTLLETAHNLAEVSKLVCQLIARAAARPRVESRVLDYLEAARQSFQALGRERQCILADLRRCDLRDTAAVAAVRLRLDAYLRQDVMRPRLVEAHGGLLGCVEELRDRSEALAWRRRDRRQAYAEFAQTLQGFSCLITGLSSDFLPGASGMGVQTLEPILRFFETLTPGVAGDPDDELARLVDAALADPSHTQWITEGGQVETLVMRLQFAFRLDDR